MLDALAIGVLALIAAIALATFRDYGLGWDDYTHSQYGELLVSLYTSGFTDKRALSFVNLYMYGGGFDMIATLAAKVLPFGLFETRRLVGAVVGLDRPVRDVAARPAARRTVRRPDRSRPRRHLPALLRPYVHQLQGRAVCGGHGARAARPRARVRRISAPNAGNARAVRCRLRSCDRRARARRLRGDGGAVSAAAHRRHQIARERVQAGARRMRIVSGAVHPGAILAYLRHGPGLAVERAFAAQSVPRGRLFLDRASKSRGASCSTAS